MATWHEDYQLGDWRISPKRNRISRGDRETGIKPKSMQVLNALADAGGEVLDRNELLEAVWPGMAVTDDVLTQSIVELRKAFEDDARQASVIETIPKVGFRLLLSVSVPDPVSTKRQTSGRRFPVIWLLALVFGAIVLWTYSSIDTPTRDQIVQVSSVPTYVVLPFADLTGKNDESQFAEGLSEEINYRLSSSPTLKVIGRTSSVVFRQRNNNIAEIGETLGVDYVIDGSVRRSGGMFRINAQLIDAADSTQLWSETFEYEVVDTLTAQDDLAASILGALRPYVGESTLNRPTANPNAYGEYISARMLLDAQDGHEALGRLHTALEYDPEFAEAAELLAFAFWQQSGVTVDPDEGRRQANEFASRAVGLAPNLKFAKALRALTVADNESYKLAIQLLDESWREQPSNSAPLRVLIYELTYRGYVDEAFRYAREFMELDPLSPIASYSIGEMSLATGRIEDALESLRLAAEFDNAFASWLIPAVQISLGNDEAASTHYEARARDTGADQIAWIRAALTAGRHRTGDLGSYIAQGRQVIATMPAEQRQVWNADLDLWFLLYGEVDKYYDRIATFNPKAGNLTDANIMYWQGILFRHTGFTTNPRFIQLSEQLGIADIWMDRGPPDFCTYADRAWVCE